jgi:hypothetical protein
LVTPSVEFQCVFHDVTLSGVEFISVGTILRPIEMSNGWIPASSAALQARAVQGLAHTRWVRFQI